MLKDMQLFKIHVNIKNAQIYTEQAVSVALKLNAYQNRGATKLIAAILWTAVFVHGFVHHHVIHLLKIATLYPLLAQQDNTKLEMDALIANAVQDLMQEPQAVHLVLQTNIHLQEVVNVLQFQREWN